jgi:hypothetical protein
MAEVSKMQEQFSTKAILAEAVLGLPVLHGIRPSLAKKKGLRRGLFWFSYKLITA